MKTLSYAQSAIAILTLSITLSSHARFEYAATHGFVSCTVCHVSPFGGGIRNETGKLYGARNLAQNGLNELSKKAWFQVDVRGEMLRAESPNETRKGLIVMTNDLALHAPAVLDENGNEKMGLVFSYGLGASNYQSGLEDTYVKFNLFSAADVTATQGDFSEAQLITGRFHVPFGIMTDEHRTYVRIQTNTSAKLWDAGVAYAHTVSPRLHYDIALTSGFENGGNTLSTSSSTTSPPTTDSPYGFVANVRVSPFSSPMLLGLSLKKDSSTKYEQDKEAYAIYAGVPTAPLGLFDGTLLFEVDDAIGWNNSAINSDISKLIPSGSAWESSLVNSRSRGSMTQLNWNLNPRTTFLVKYEQFIPDLNFSGDDFRRTGVGSKFYLNSNTDLNLRYEHSASGRSGLSSSTTLPATEDFIYLLMHVWI